MRRLGQDGLHGKVFTSRRRQVDEVHPWEPSGRKPTFLASLLHLVPNYRNTCSCFLLWGQAEIRRAVKKFIGIIRAYCLDLDPFWYFWRFCWQWEPSELESGPRLLHCRQRNWPKAIVVAAAQEKTLGPVYLTTLAQCPPCSITTLLSTGPTGEMF